MNNLPTYKQHVSQELLNALSKGDHNAYTEIYARYRKSIYDFLYLLIRSHEIAEDITHNVFIGVWENRTRLNPTQGIERYLFVVAKFMAMRYFRRKKVEDTHVEYLWTQRIKDIVPEEFLYAKEADLLVDVAISKMPNIRKQIFIMHYKGGFDYIQIAETLGMKKATVANHLTNARNDVRKMLQNCIKSDAMICKK